MPVRSSEPCRWPPSNSTTGLSPGFGDGLPERGVSCIDSFVIAYEERSTKYHPVYRLASTIHERELKRPEYKYDVVPDAFLDFRMSLDGGKQRRMCILLEHDCASEHINAFKPRIRAYVRMLKTEAHKDLYGAGIVTIAFTTIKGEAHIEKLVRWTREELTEERCLQSLVHFFYFTNLTPPLDPKVLWLEPVWKTIYTDEPCSLLAG